MASLSLLCRVFLGLVGFSLAGSLFCKLAALNPGAIAPVASALTIGVGFCAVFEPTLRMKQGLGILVLFFALLAAAAIELSGILAGLPFGRYAYTIKWQPVVYVAGHWFPMMLPVAWLLVVGSSTIICAKLRWPLLLAAILATMVDFVMEPVMTGPLDYWRWTSHGPLPGGASILNPFGWLLTSLGLAWILSRESQNNRLSATAVLIGHLVLTFGIGAIALIPR